MRTAVKAGRPSASGGTAPGGASGWPAVHQFLPILLDRDATGSHTLGVRDALRRRGIRSELFVRHGRPGQEGLVRDWMEYESLGRPDDVLIYQFGSPSDLAEYLVAKRRRLVLYFHNLTPPECYRAWSADAAAAQSWGRFQLGRLAGAAEACLAPSSFSISELDEAGARRCALVPLMWEPAAAGPAAGEQPVGDRPGGEGPVGQRSGDRPAETGRLPGDLPGGRARPAGARWLFVGRLAPNKAQEDLVAALHCYRQAYDAAAELCLVGRGDPPRYAAAVERFARQLGLGDAVALRDGLSPGELAAEYRRADVLVSASRHEGFCIPLVEAMSAGLPVVARAAAAVPETLGEGGVLVPVGEGPAALAAAAHLVLSDPARRERLVAAGRRQVSLFSRWRAEDALWEALGSVVGLPRP